MSPFWSPEPLFAGATVFILGGGPSLRGFDFSRLAGRRVIAVNEAIKHYPNADLLYFWDDTWFIKNRGIVHYRQGLTATGSRVAAASQPRLRRVDIQPAAPLQMCCQAVRKGRSSGHTAVALAVACGAARVVLLGYNMRLVDGRSHYHDAYAARDPERMSGEWLPAFGGWHAEAQAIGCEIVNATPGSALTEFPMVDLDAELEHGSIAAAGA